MKFVDKITDSISSILPINTMLVNKKFYNTMMGNMNALIRTDPSYGDEQAFGR